MGICFAALTVSLAGARIPHWTVSEIEKLKSAGHSPSHLNQVAGKKAPQKRGCLETAKRN